MRSEDQDVEALPMSRVDTSLHALDQARRSYRLQRCQVCIARCGEVKRVESVCVGARGGPGASGAVAAMLDSLRCIVADAGAAGIAVESTEVGASWGSAALAEAIVRFVECKTARKTEFALVVDATRRFAAASDLNRFRILARLAASVRPRTSAEAPARSPLAA